jgi:hypothetical protein
MPDRQLGRSSSLSGLFKSFALAVAVVVVVGGSVVSVVSEVSSGALSVGGALVGVVGGVVVSVVVSAVVSRALRNAGRVGSDRRYANGSVLRKAARLLPAADREEYVEEWRSWLWDMRETGQPWYRRLVELLYIVVIATPRLAITLRLSRRVVD